MNFTDVKPYVRLVQKITIDKSASDKFVNRRVVPRDCRFFYCADGAGEIVFGGAVHKMEPGDVVIFPAGCDYRLVSPVGFVKYVAVNFDYTFECSSIVMPVQPVPIEDYSEGLLLQKKEFEDGDELNSALFIKKVSRVENKLTKMLDTYSRKVIFYELELSSVFMTVLIQCKRALKLNSLYRTNSSLDVCFEYIRENFNKHLTNEDIADKFGYNRNYISSLVKLATGVTLHKYLQRIRIEKAIEYLEQSDKSISEIAELCGFYDIYHFSKVFKSTMGKSPSEYRK
jgi:AraC-like DNA-binding protein